MNKLFEKLLKGEYKNRTIFFLFLLLGLIIYSPYITSPFYYDDFFFVSLIESKQPYNEFVGLWSANIEELKSFESIWWRDSGANVKFIRPVPSVVISSAIKFFGRDAALPLHLFSIILHSCAAFTVFLVFNRLSKRYAVSLTAGFLFLICVHHSGTIAWISTVTDIIAVLFMNLCLYYYIKQSENRSRFYLLLSTLFLIIALLSKETAVITSVAILLYELTVNSSPNLPVRERIKEFLRKWKSWGISFVILVFFLAAYKFGGFGAESAMYYNPLTDPLTYLLNLLTGYPVLITGYLSLFPIIITLFVPALLDFAVIFGYFLFAILAVALLPYRRDSVIQFSLLLLIAAVLPQLSAEASERLLYYPYVAGSYLISFLIFQLKFLKKKYSAGTPEPLRITGTAFGYYLFVSSLILSFVLSIYYPYSFKSALELPQKFVLESKRIADGKNIDTIIFLNTPGPFTGLYVNDIYRFYSGEYKDIQVLSNFNGKIWINKLSDSSFVLKTDSKGWLSNMFAKVLRKDPEIEEGIIYSYPNFDAVILKTTDDRLDVFEVRFDFKFNLTGQGILILYYDGSTVKKWEFTVQKRREWIFVGDTSNVMKLFF